MIQIPLNIDSIIKLSEIVGTPYRIGFDNSSIGGELFGMVPRLSDKTFNVYGESSLVEVVCDSNGLITKINSDLVINVPTESKIYESHSNYSTLDGLLKHIDLKSAIPPRSVTT